MRRFVILFDEKEGTSPVVRLLDKFERVSVLHQIDNKGWEPFDRNNCGPMTRKAFRQCLDMIWGPEPVDMAALNRIYTRTSRRPLETFSKDNAVGFKMRFRPPYSAFPLARRLPAIGRFMQYKPASAKLGRPFREPGFKRLMLEHLKRHDVLVFMAVRQDIFHWALSKYHGDGTGKKGHLQFALAERRITRDEIPKVTVDCRRLARIANHCEAIHARKARLLQELSTAGIANRVLLYEDFLDDSAGYFRKLLEHLEVDVPKDQISGTLSAGSGLEKVHSSDISSFVTNHEEVVEKFGSRFAAWS